MTQNPNPFVRGYWNLRVVRTLCICYGDGSPHVWRSIHTSQAHLSDNDLISSPCIVTSDFALIKSGTDAISDELIAECDAVEGINGEGVVGAVVYAIHGDDLDGRPVHVGDTCRIPYDHMVACETGAGGSGTNLSWPASAYCS